MSKITGKRIGQLIISSDVVTTTSDVEQYVNSISADLQQAIEQTVASGYVPTSRKINGTPLSGDINVGTITGITMNGASRGTAGNIDLGDVLTAVPSAYNTYDETKQSLSGDGYATQEQLNEKSAVSVDNVKADVNLQHISQEDYEQLVASGEVLSNALYVVSADYVETYGQQIKNVADPTDLSDAVTKGYVDRNFQPAGSYLTAVPDAYKTYASTKSSLSSDGYATQSQLDTKSSISVDSGFAPTFKFEHISLEDYISKSISGIVDGNTLYDISSENMTVFDQKIVDLAPGEDPTDAPNMSQLTEVSARACDTYTQSEVDSKIRYSLNTASTLTSGTTQTVELADRANNSIAQESGITTVALAFPTATSGKARDFILALTCGSTPPNVVFPAGVTIVVDDQTDLTAEEGTNLYSFTEISANTFVVSRLLVSAYSAQ